jgi:hypothetical protein
MWLSMFVAAGRNSGGDVLAGLTVADCLNTHMHTAGPACMCIRKFKRYASRVAACMHWFLAMH